MGAMRAHDGVGPGLMAWYVVRSITVKAKGWPGLARTEFLGADFSVAVSERAAER